MEPWDLRNNHVVSSQIFIYISHIPGTKWRRQSRTINRYQEEKNKIKKTKPALSEERTSKGKAQKRLSGEAPKPIFLILNKNLKKQTNPGMRYWQAV